MAFSGNFGVENGKKEEVLRKGFPFHPLFLYLAARQAFFQQIFSIFIIRMDWCVCSEFKQVSKSMSKLYRPDNQSFINLSSKLNAHLFQYYSIG